MAETKDENHGKVDHQETVIKVPTAKYDNRENQKDCSHLSLEIDQLIDEKIDFEKPTGILSFHRLNCTVDVKTDRRCFGKTQKKYILSNLRYLN